MDTLSTATKCKCHGKYSSDTDEFSKLLNNAQEEILAVIMRVLFAPQRQRVQIM